MKSTVGEYFIIGLGTFTGTLCSLYLLGKEFKMRQENNRLKQDNSRIAQEVVQLRQEVGQLKLERTPQKDTVEINRENPAAAEV